MSKPTIFFSHSSKDKEIVLTIKKKIDAITGGVLDIFLTSDGQSIPLGTNWVHKIEEGLTKATIMFLFMTPNSVNSNWVNFEAGFAYSKKIFVVPVGIGIDIAQLKPPISLLQGFNITSGDGLNNFISIINNKFEYHFEEIFTDNDFSIISEFEKNEINKFDISEIFDSIKFQISEDSRNWQDDENYYDIFGFCEKIIKYLVNQKIPFSIEEAEYKKTILVMGIKIVYIKGEKLEGVISSKRAFFDKLFFSLSPNNFENSFFLYSELMKLLNNTNRLALDFYLNSNYAYISREEHISALLSKFPDTFLFSKNVVGGFIFTKADIRFLISNITNNSTEELNELIMTISYNQEGIYYQDINNLLSSLIKMKIIFHILIFQKNFTMFNL